MPELPTLPPLSNAQAQRVLNAYGSSANFLAWLREGIKMYVLTYEAEQIREQADASVQALREELGTGLLPPD